MPKISVIIPVYNTSKFLEKCIDSVINQSYRDLEIIIINDGSTDNSEEIILKYQKKDNRIKYYKHENIGLGPTRNRGIDMANGEYILFIDSDDFIVEDSIIELLNKAISEKADVVCGEVLLLNSSGSHIRREFKGLKTIDLKKESLTIFFREYYFGRIYSHNAWDKLFRTNFLKENKILFGDNKIIFAEDNYFQFQVLLAAPIISFLDKPFYYYVMREGSIMNSYKKNVIKRHLEMINFFKHISKGEIFDKVIDLIIYDGFIIETINIIENNLKLKDLRNSFNDFYQSKIYKEFLISMNKNKSYLLEPNKMKRNVIRLSTFLLKNRLNFLFELFLYITYKIIR